MKRVWQNHRAVMLIAIAALTVRLIFIGSLVWLAGESYAHRVLAPGSDSTRYLQLGENLRTRGVYSDATSPPYTPEETIEPLYPAFLAGATNICGGVICISVAQAFIAAIATMLVYANAALFLSRRMSAGAALLFAFEPVGAYLSTAIFTESIFVPLLLASTYFFLRGTGESVSRRDVGVAGLFLGFAALTRPEAPFLLVVILAVYLFTAVVRRPPTKEKNSARESRNGYNGESSQAWYVDGYRYLVGGKFWKEALVGAVIFVLGFLLAASPLLIRNKIRHGSWQTSSIGIHKVYLFDLLYFYAHENNTPFREAREYFRKRVSAISPYRNDNPSFANAPYLRHVAWEYIRERPVAYTAFYLVKTIPFFANDGLRYLADKLELGDAPTLNITGALLQRDIERLTTQLRDPRERVSATLLFVGSLFWLVISISMCIGVAYALQKKNREILLPVLLFFTIVVGVALMSGPVSNARLRYKVTPFMYITALFGAAQVLHVRLNREKALQSALAGNEEEKNGVA